MQVPKAGGQEAIQAPPGGELTDVAQGGGPPPVKSQNLALRHPGCARARAFLGSGSLTGSRLGYEENSSEYAESRS